MSPVAVAPTDTARRISAAEARRDYDAAMEAAKLAYDAATAAAERDYAAAIAPAERARQDAMAAAWRDYAAALAALDALAGGGAS